MRRALLLFLVAACGGPPKTGAPASPSGTARHEVPRPRPRAETPAAPARSAARVASLAAGGSVSCTCLLDGTVWCWGDDRFGQLALASDDQRTVPRPARVGGVSDAVQVAIGDAHACALRVDGSVLCWGFNYSGALGVGMERLDATLPPTPVPGVVGAIRIAAGEDGTCVVAADRSVLCWGDYDPGVGDPRPIGAVAPVKVLGVKGAADVAVGDMHACALLTSGKVTCWRKISPGLVPRGKVRADPLAVRIGAPATRISLNAYGAAVLASGKVRCWGQGGCGFDLDPDRPASRDYAASFMVPELDDVAEVALGLGLVCARLKSGAVSCAESGALKPVYGVAGAASLAIGHYHACALTRQGEVLCWGENGHGELGDGTTEPRDVPVTVRF